MTTRSLLQPGWTETVLAVNGVHLHVVEAGDRSAPLLILLHGFPEFWWAWRRQIDPFARAGYHVVVPDLRGYNTSSKPAGRSAYGFDVLVADVLAIADALEAERFCLVGHDWGAAIAWGVAAQAPGRLERVVVMNGPNLDLWRRQALKHPSQALRSSYMAAFQLPWLPEMALAACSFAALKATMRGSAKAGTFEHGALDRYVEAWRHPGALTAMLNYYRALRQRRSRKTAARIRPPLLIVWGSADRFLERHVMEAGLDLCDDGRFLAIAGATHWLHLEKPERINREILEFLAGGGRPPTGSANERSQAQSSHL